MAASEVVFPTWVRDAGWRRYELVWRFDPRDPLAVTVGVDAPGGGEWHLARDLLAEAFLGEGGDGRVRVRADYPGGLLRLVLTAPGGGVRCLWTPLSVVDAFLSLCENLVTVAEETRLVTMQVDSAIRRCLEAETA